MSDQKIIKLRFRYVEGDTKTRRYKTLEGARKAAQERFGKYPEIGSFYVADEGARLTVEGAKLSDLFPEAFASL